ncbi:MAG: dTDP-4-dehydrorhamnose reductase [Anaerolineae bacterium]
MRIVITGSQGQLGQALQKVLQHEQLLLVDLPEYDITSLQDTLYSVRSFAPDVIIHTAAMTDVDGCERAPDLAYRTNVAGTRNLAVAAQENACSLVYISTDYVFDGTKSQAYWEYDDTNPQSVYARTKWVGEQIVRQLVSKHYIVRIAWLYGQSSRNFPRTVIRLARERGQLTMVTDEVGSPTSASEVSTALEQLIRVPAYGTYHLPNSGTCSRYEWALYILELAGIQGVTVTPSTDYQRVARVPKHVELYNFMGAEVGIVMRPWQEALREYLNAG